MLTLAISRSSIQKKCSFQCHKWESSKMCLVWNVYRWKLENALNVIMHGLRLPKNRIRDFQGWVPKECVVVFDGALHMFDSTFTFDSSFYCCWFWLESFWFCFWLGFWVLFCFVFWKTVVYLKACVDILFSLLPTVWEKKQIIAHTSCEDLRLQSCVPVKVTPKELIYEDCVPVEQET